MVVLTKGYDLGRVVFGGRVGKISVTHNRLLGFIFQTCIDIAIVSDKSNTNRASCRAYIASHRSMITDLCLR